MCLECTAEEPTHMTRGEVIAEKVIVRQLNLGVAAAVTEYSYNTYTLKLHGMSEDSFLLQLTKLLQLREPPWMM